MLLHRTAALWLAASVLGWAGCAVDDSELDARRLPVTASQPNIVVIMTDDLDSDLLQTMLDLHLAPNIEQYLVAEGTSFTDSFVSNSLCCPSRATMLTGQYSHNNGVFGVGPLLEHGGVDALDDVSTLATWLQAAGYRTGHVGKYLNGYGSRLDDTTPSFQIDYVPPGWDHWQALVGNGTYKMFNYKINDTRGKVQRFVYYSDARVENYQTTVLTRRAVDFINDSRGRSAPFFLEVTPLAPHAESGAEHDTRWSFFIRPDPQDEIDKPDQLALIRSLEPSFLDDPSWNFVAPEAPSYIRRRNLTETDIANLTRFYRERLAAMLAVDDMVGEIVQTLFDRGMLDETIILFTSDNGWLWGQHHLVGKQVPYEESIRVPLYIRMPAPDGGTVTTTVSQMVANVDLAPTIAQLAGASPGVWVDGRSLVPLLSVDPPATQWRHQLLVEHWIQEGHIPSYAALRTGRYVYVDYFESSPPMRELYDLDLDPFQVSNVEASPDYADVVVDLQQRLAAMRDCALGSCQELEEQ